MHRLSKIGILVLYPVLQFGMPIIFFGVLALQVSQDSQLGSGLSSIGLVSGLLSFLLLVCIAVYAYSSIKHKTFSPRPDGTRKANVSDWFAAVFAALALWNIMSNILNALS